MKSIKLDFAENLQDKEILDKVISGDTDLYEVIIRRYNQRLYRVGRSFFRNNDEEIEDVMQFTYIRAFEKLSSFENRSAFSTWLTRIFINEALARKKYGNRFISHPDEDINYENYKTDMKTPYTIAANTELKELLEKSIDELPEKYKVVFVMHEVEKLSVRETGECLNISESNVKVRLTRARKMLRDNLSHYYKSDEIFSFNLVRCDVIVNNVFGYIRMKKAALIN